MGRQAKVPHGGWTCDRCGRAQSREVLSEVWTYDQWTEQGQETVWMQVCGDCHEELEVEAELESQVR